MIPRIINGAKSPKRNKVETRSNWTLSDTVMSACLFIIFFFYVLFFLFNKKVSLSRLVCRPIQKRLLDLKIFLKKNKKFFYIY